MRHTHLHARQLFFRLSYEFRKRHEFRVHVPVTHVFRKDHKFRLTPGHSPEFACILSLSVQFPSVRQEKLCNTRPLDKEIIKLPGAGTH